MTFGEVGYMGTDGKIYKGLGTGIDTANIRYMCGQGTIGAGTAGTWLIKGIAEDPSWNFTPGKLLFLHMSTHGAMSMTSGTSASCAIQILGSVMNSTSRVFFDPEQVQAEYKV